jgi:hypothetical protein
MTQSTFHDIIHAKDHFSKLSTLYPLPDKRAITVAYAFKSWITGFGPHELVQNDNRLEF